MVISSEVDSLYMRYFGESSIADLERGIKNAERWSIELDQIYRPTHEQRIQRHALLKHTELLRAELKRRQEGVGKIVQNETVAAYDVHKAPDDELYEG